jgi:hypothetical protein
MKTPKYDRQRMFNTRCRSGAWRVMSYSRPKWLVDYDARSCRWLEIRTDKSAPQARSRNRQPDRSDSFLVRMNLEII